jgi:uncharacterized damage-inducible protein DinB
MPRPLSADYAPYYEKYVSRVPEEDILPALTAEIAGTLTVLAGVSAEEELKLHAPYTWTIRQVVGHLLDAERVFAYRALWFARGETTPLPGFDEGPFSANAPHARVPLPELAAEFRDLRATTTRLFAQLDAAAWDRRGVASLGEVTVRALAYMIVGHERHHMTIVRKRLGV